MPIVGHCLKAIQLAAPVSVLPTDQIRLVGGVLEVVRDGLVISTEQVAAATEIQAGEPVTARVMTEVFIVEAVQMPGQNVSLTRVTENQVMNTVTFYFSNGNVREMTWAGCEEIANNVDSLPTVAEDVLIGRTYRMSPDGANKTNQVGASMSSNLIADVPLVYTEPQ